MSGFVLRSTSVSPLDRDKGTLPLTRKNVFAFFRCLGAEGAEGGLFF